MLTYKERYDAIAKVQNLLLTGPEAVCVLDAKLEIRQHNQLASLLLGYRGRKLTGQHLSGILYDDTMIRNLLASISSSGWFQGECTLRTSSDLPLAVKCRVADYEDFPPLTRRSEIRGATRQPEHKKRYVMVFRETDEAQRSGYERRLTSLQFLLDAVSKRDMEPEDVLLGFARAFDRHAGTVLLPPDFSEDKGKSFLLSQSATEAAQEAVCKRVVVLHRDENLPSPSFSSQSATRQWCFFPACSRSEIHGIACIRFAVPRLYGEEDKEIFGLAGMVLGAYMETCTSRSWGSASQSLLQAIFNNTDRPMVVVDRNGAITSCNATAQTIYGYTESEMMGRSFGDIVFPADGSVRYEDMLNRVMRGDSIEDEEMTHLRSDWTRVDVSVTAYPYTLDDGLIVGAVFILRDLREKRRLWGKMMHWEKQLALGELVSCVANELNNPLTALMGYSQMLLHRKNDEEIDSMVSTIYRAAKRCGSTVRNILDLARGDGAQGEFSHINDVVIAALNLKRRQLEANNIEVCVNLGEGIPETAVDLLLQGYGGFSPYDMERLFLRIINYAEQRMVEYDNGGRLAVETAFEEGNSEIPALSDPRIVIRFTDTGTLIPKDDIAEILDPFSSGVWGIFPIFAAGREDEGIGLGLSISCQIIQNAGGNIRVDRQLLGLGDPRNVFTVELPAAKETSPDVVEHSEILALGDPRTEETVACALETGKRIMVVDDEPAITTLLTEVLHQMGHVTDIAGDGNEAMKKLDTENYDLIIADLRMPSGFTGDKLYRLIKFRDPELAQQMVFITGDVANPETQKFLQSTGNPYLEKPFLLGSLRETIQKTLIRR